MKLGHPFLATLILFALNVGSAHGQGSVSLDVKVVDNQGRSLPNLPVVLRERATAAEIKSRTDARGDASFKLTSGDQWLVYVNGRRYGREFITVKEDIVAEQSIFITHDPAYEDRIARQTFRRDTLTETDIRNIPVPARSQPDHTLLEVLVRNSEGKVQPGMKVRVVDLAASRAWWKSSDASGRAVFHLPVGRAYDMDVEDQLNATFYDPESMGEGMSMTSRLVMTYDRYRVIEQRRGDTTRQQVAAGEPMRHSKGLLRLHVERDGAPAVGEKVFVDDVRSKKVWEAVTDSAGNTALVLPFGTRYLVHFRYQRDVEAVDFIPARKQAEADLNLEYDPDPEMEFPDRYVPTNWRNSVWPFDRYRRLPYPENANGGPWMGLRGSGPVRAGQVSAVLQAGIRIPSIDVRSIGPLNIGFVLDISGSMATDDNIEHMKTAVIRMLQQMRPTDVVSITLFDDHPELLLPAQQLGTDADRIAALVRSIGPRGGTVVSEALRVAARQVLTQKAGGGTALLVLATDGYVFDGDTALKVLKTYVPRLGCIAVGVGKGCEAGFLQQVAVLSGRQPVIGAGDSLSKSFSRRIFAKLEPVVSDVRLRFLLPEGLKPIEVYGGRYDSLHRSVLMKAEGAYPEEEITALMALQRSPSYRGGKVGVVAGWYDIRRGRRDSSVEWIDPFEASGSPAAVDVKRIYAMARGFASLERMVQLGMKRSFDPAIQSLQDGLSTMDAVHPRNEDGDKEVMGLRRILEASLGIMRELRRKSLLPH